MFDVNSIERIFLCIISLASHFMYNKQLAWYVPKNGATPISIVALIRDSSFITLICLIETMSCRYIKRISKTSTPVFIDIVNNSVFGKITSKRFDNKRFSFGALYNENLMNTKSTKSSDSNGIIFVKIVDRCLIFLILFFYIYLYIKFTPSSSKKIYSEQ